MTRTFRNLFALLLAATVAALGGCALQRGESATLYDLGPLKPATLPALPAIGVAEVAVPPWLDRSLMFFRLNYQNEQQPRPYAHSRWVMPPAQLIAQRLKSRIAHAGGVALSASDGALNVPVLRIEVEDFTQSFHAPGESVGQVAWRASLFRGRSLVAQKVFSQKAPAPSGDADGGARALAAASDAAIADMMQWLAAQPLK